jgi:hypothetical protein
MRFRKLNGLTGVELLEFDADRVAVQAIEVVEVVEVVGRHLYQRHSRVSRVLAGPAKVRS